MGSLGKCMKWTIVSALIGGGLFLTVFCYVNPHAVLDTFNIEIADAAEQGIQLNFKAGGTVSGCLFGSFWMILGIYNSWQAMALKVVSSFDSSKRQTTKKSGWRTTVPHWCSFNQMMQKEVESYSYSEEVVDLSKKYKKRYRTKKDDFLVDDLTRLKIKKDHDKITHWLSGLYLVIGLAAITTSCLFGAGIFASQGVGLYAFSVSASILFLGSAIGLFCDRVSAHTNKSDLKSALASMNRKAQLEGKMGKIELNQKFYDNTGNNCRWKPAKVTTSVSSSEKYRVNRLEKEYSKWKEEGKLDKLRIHEGYYHKEVKEHCYSWRR